jgi:hypothetical protein
MRRDAPRGTPRYLAWGTRYVLNSDRKYFSTNNSPNNLEFGIYVKSRQKTLIICSDSVDSAGINDHIALHSTFITLPNLLCNVADARVCSELLSTSLRCSMVDAQT